MGGNKQMKKRRLIIVVCIAAASILAAIGILLALNNGGQQGPVKPKKAYKDTLVDMQEFLSTPKAEEDIADGMYGVYEAIQALGDAAADTVGYAYTDLNEDGQKELLIGNFTGTGAPDVKNEIYGAYTYHMGIREPLFEKQKRNTYALTDTGTLYFYGSDGVAFHIVAEYQMTEEGIVCIDFYFSYPKYGDINNLEYFHNTTGEWDPKVSEKVDMTYEQFEEIRKNLAARTVSIDAELLSEIG
jgi:hypothetical protein